MSDFIFRHSENGDEYRAVLEPLRQTYKVYKAGRFLTDYEAELVKRYIDEGVWVIEEQGPVFNCSSCSNPREDEFDYICNGCRERLYV